MRWQARRAPRAAACIVTTTASVTPSAHHSPEKLHRSRQHLSNKRRTTNPKQRAPAATPAPGAPSHAAERGGATAPRPNPDSARPYPNPKESIRLDFNAARLSSRQKPPAFPQVTNRVTRALPKGNALKSKRIDFFARKAQRGPAEMRRGRATGAAAPLKPGGGTPGALPPVAIRLRPQARGPRPLCS